MSGELVSPPRLKNPSIPKAISDIVMRAMAPEVTARYQRAADLLDDVLAARHARRGAPAPRRPRRWRPARAVHRDDAHGIQTAAARARDAGPALLLAVPQAAARAHRSVPVLRGTAIRNTGIRTEKQNFVSSRGFGMIHVRLAPSIRVDP